MRKFMDYQVLVETSIELPNRLHYCQLKRVINRSIVILLQVSKTIDRKSTRLNSSHTVSSYAVFCFKKKLPGIKVLSALNLEALPPFDGVPREHFGYRDRLSQPVIEETGEQPTPGSGAAVKAGEFFLGYEDEGGAPPRPPEPELLSRNGSYLAYLRM